MRREDYGPYYLFTPPGNFWDPRISVVLWVIAGQIVFWTLVRLMW